jgi:hypothetical protein
MKKMIFAAVAVAVVGMSAQTARAGDREWATVGKVLTGVAAGVVIARAVDCEPTYVSASYGYASPSYSVSYTTCTPPPCPPPRVVCAPPVVYAPAPVVYQPVYYTPRPVYCAPAPVYHVSYGYSGRGYGHSNGRGWGHR